MTDGELERVTNELTAEMQRRQERTMAYRIDRLHDAVDELVVAVRTQVVKAVGWLAERLGR